MTISFRRMRIGVAIFVIMTALAIAMITPAACEPYAVGDEFQIANVVGPAVEIRGQTNIAAGAGKYLAVWRDRRSGERYDIYGIFLNENGQPLSDESFLITCDAKGDPIPLSASHPAVAFNGTHFLVVWDAAPDGPDVIYGTRVTTSGQVLDPGGFQISTAYTDNQSFPAVASNGIDWQVVWQKGGAIQVPDILSATISGTTRNITKRISIATTDAAELSPSIAWNGRTGSAARYLVTWEEQMTDPDIKGCLIDHLGNKLSASAIVISNRANQPNAGAAGAQYGARVAGGLDSSGNQGGWVAVWEDCPTDTIGSTSDVRATRISATGVVQDAGGILVFSEYGKYNANWNYYNSTPSVAWNGQSYQIICRHGLSTRNPWARTLTYGGTLGTAKQLSTTASCNPTGLGIAGGVGANKGSVMVSEMSGSNVVWACYMNAAGTGGSGQTISLTKQDQQLGESVWNGTNHVVVWADKRYGALSSLIYAARVQQDGTVLDPQGVMVSSASGTQSQPAIAWSPTENMYMVVWRQSTALAGNYDIKAMRLDANLNKIGYEITVTSFDMDRTNPAVAWNGSNFLVVWADNRPIDGLWDIYGSRVSTTGVPSSSVYICTDAGTQILPAVTAGDSGNCLVTWQDKWQMKYEYAIGTSFKGTNTRNWTTVPATSTEPAGTATEVTASVSPPMTIGLTYYVSVRATNRDGTKSDVGCSDGIKIVSPGSPVPPAPSGMSGQSVPSTPTVVDDGVTQTSRTTLHASWSSSYDNFGEPAIMARVVPATGNLGTVKRVSSTAAGKSEPKVAYDGSNYLVVWSQATTSVHGALLTSANNRVTPDPAGDILITTGSAKGHHPSVAWDGSKYVVTWEDKRSYTNNKTDIYAARISDDGTVQDNDGGMLISQAPRAETTPIISSISPLQSMAFYTYEKYSSYRLQAREIWTTQPPPPEYPLEEAKQLPDGTVVSIIGLPVTAGNDQFAGIFYIEDKQRIQGIKVVWNESTIFEGMVVTVSGTITTANGERQINATSVTVSPTPEVFLVPFGIRPAYMGGVAAGLVPGVVGGVMGPRGANNIGLLVKCWGVVQNAAGSYFELREPNGEVVRVKTPSALPTEGLMYAVTGISSCEPVAGGYGSLLLARKAVDVQALQ